MGPAITRTSTAQGGQLGQVFWSSPKGGNGNLRVMFLLAIAAATRRILIANAYFVPDQTTVDMLVAARRRGVDVEIIVPGPILDAQVVRRASRLMWGPMLEAGVKIFEYQPTMYHTKVMVVDDIWCSVGSTNFDDRSFRLNQEANLNVLRPRIRRRPGGGLREGPGPVARDHGSRRGGIGRSWSGSRSGWRECCGSSCEIRRRCR